MMLLKHGDACDADGEMYEAEQVYSRDPSLHVQHSAAIQYLPSVQLLLYHSEFVYIGVIVVYE